MAYRHVVVGTDGSVSATRAVQRAASIAAEGGAELTVVTAFWHDSARDARAQAEAPDELRLRVTGVGVAEEQAAAGKRVAEEAGAPTVATRVGAGDPAEVLRAKAEALGADLIVVGSKGMTGAARFLLGSVPNKVSHHAVCDLLIVHTS